MAWDVLSLDILSYIPGEQHEQHEQIEAKVLHYSMK